MTQRLTVLLAQWGTEVIPVALSSSLNAAQRLPRHPRHYAASTWLRPCSLPYPVSQNRTVIFYWGIIRFHSLEASGLWHLSNTKNNWNWWGTSLVSRWVAHISDTNCLSSVCGKLGPSRVQSVVSSQGSLDSDMQGECSSRAAQRFSKCVVVLLKTVNVIELGSKLLFSKDCNAQKTASKI